MKHRGLGVSTGSAEADRHVVAFTPSVFLVLLCCCLGLCVVTARLQAAEAAIVMGGSNWYPPFHYPAENAVGAAGFDVAVAQTVVAELGRPLVFHFDNWNDVLLALEAGTIDMVPMFVSDDRRERFLFSDPFNVEFHQLFGLASQAALRDLSGLSGLRVAMEESAFAAEQLTSINPDALVLKASSEAEALRMVARGEAEYALIPAQVAYHTIRTEALSSVLSLSPPLLPVSYAFAVSRASPELVPLIDAQLQVMQRNGSLQQLRAAWLYPAEEPGLGQGSSFYLWLTGLFLLIALLSLYYHLSRINRLKQRFTEQSSALELAQEQLRTLQLTDHLTGLATRQYFLHRLEERLTSMDASTGQLVVGMIMVRDMGTIEHSLGPTVVDQLIASMARQLSSLQIGELGYFGSSRFVVLMNNLEDGCAAAARMQEVMRTLGRDYVIDGAAINVNPIAGFSVSPRDGDAAGMLLRNAMVAMNQAWSENRVLVEYEPGFSPDPVNYTLMADLRQALANGALSWVFQPQYDIQRSTIIGAEMLVRWEHPVLGMVPPDLFIPMAEQSDLIQLITRQALAQAVKVLKDWRKAKRQLQLSVNVSPNDLADHGFVSEILALVGDLATSLTLEITEVAVAQNGVRLIDGVNRLKLAGVRISLDDYGTGYASLTHLKELNFDELKIDRSFIACISSNERLLRLTRASILLGLELGCQIVAEGVEDAETAALLRDQGCYLLQGYLVSRPLSLSTFNKFIDMPLAFAGHPFNRWGEPASMAGNDH